MSDNDFIKKLKSAISKPFRRNGGGRPEVEGAGSGPFEGPELAYATTKPEAARTKDHYNFRQIWYLPRPTLLEEVRSRKLIILGIEIIAAILLALLVWSAIMEIQETSATFGELQPVGQVKVVQHLEGGIIAEMFVKNGDFVEKGQPLVQLDPATALAELQQLEARRVALVLDAKRLRAFVQGEMIADKSGDNKSELFEERTQGAQAIASMLKDEKLLLELQKLSQESQRDVFGKQVEQREEAVAKLREQQRLLKENIKLIEEEKSMHERLYEQKVVSKRDYLRIQREMNDAYTELARLSGQIEEAYTEMEESQSRLNELDSKIYEAAIEDLGNISSELFQITFAIEKLNDRLQKLTVKAPVSGLVKGLDATIGRVVEPGGVILSVVPKDAKLQVITKITTMDIGHVKVGDPVNVKIFTYSFARYGAVKGKLNEISATTFLDEEGMPYYKGVVTLDEQYVGNKTHMLLPGMTVQADIITGEKTLLQYLLKPIHVTIATAFSER